ncbi:hypothetical protein WA1_12055 [Scytonema hofmannii PCC 7110]|uniref:Uncharacterized protein n=1 Tax=Scytonema hofmannii PCC 7110 TaxID=128403 RepID=A0A139XDS6_9CYAN|nr:hypothetical protein [Scytonema hofmannii]KYC42851.1 hypothetical protein WA1_12055 [Scytonema hofmannii PCC 7110]
MTDRQVSEMTIETLKEFVREIVDEQLKRRQHFRQDERSVEEVLTTMDRIRWTPPPGSPTTLELLREAREQ